jgi:hypothetical protein
MLTHANVYTLRISMKPITAQENNWRSPIRKSTQIGQVKNESRVEIHLRPQAKNCFHFTIGATRIFLWGGGGEKGDPEAI